MNRTQLIKNIHEENSSLTIAMITAVMEAYGKVASRELANGGVVPVSDAGRLHTRLTRGREYCAFGREKIKIAPRLHVLFSPSKYFDAMLIR